MSAVEQASTDPVVRATLEESGWRPDYHWNADAWRDWLRAQGYSVHKAGLSWLEGLGGLRIVPPSSNRAVFASGPLRVDPVWAATGESPRIREREEQFQELLCPVGEWADQYIILVSEQGRVLAETTFQVLHLGADMSEALLRLIVADSRPVEVRV